MKILFFVLRLYIVNFREVFLSLFLFFKIKVLFFKIKVLIKKDCIILMKFFIFKYVI